MASLTVRQLDERIKTMLRMRAARNGRSVEDEVRTILRAAGEDAGTEAPVQFTRPGRQPARPAASLAAPAKNRVLLVIGGGIAAYKSLDLIRRLRERGCTVRCILTEAAQEFVTPLAAGTLSGEQVFTDLFDAKSEFDVGHVRLAREADLIVVAPATADFMAKLANGHADDLATTVLLATTAKVLLAPAMNPRMWAAKPTQRNLKILAADGFAFVGPGEGEMAESGERGLGRMAEPLEIAAAAAKLSGAGVQLLKGKRVLITSGPTHEPIDPVRYIANRSSGKQGHAIAAAAAEAGALVILVSGPVNLPDPPGVTTVHVETAREMLDAVERALPADVAIFAAAVADWRVTSASAQKIKKESGKAMPNFALAENPDILSTVAHRTNDRPSLVIGFAAETENVVAHARDKLKRKGCDWILANDVSPQTGIMGGDSNAIEFVSPSDVERWPPQSKDDVARMLIARVAEELEKRT